MVDINSSCTLRANGTYECGTGSWVGPLPGDPSTSDVSLTATAAFGGIDINLTWPQINGEAVAYIALYRSLLPDVNSATYHAQFNGNFYYDKINDPNKPVYYYWVRVMSVHGTFSDYIGPEWAVAKPLIDDLMVELTGKIDSGVLAQSLKQDIDQIGLNKNGITQEMLDRAANDDTLGIRISEVGAHSGDTRALLQEEVLARTNQGEAFVQTVNTLYAELNGNISAVQVTVTALTTKVDSLAQQITNVESNFNDNLAQVQQTLQTNINTVDGKVTAIGARYTVMVNVNGLAGGFGIYNDGTTVEAGFDVDRFWIGRTQGNKRKPFIIENDVVYMDEAAINKLTFSKLRDESGSFIVENGKIKAQYLTVETLVANEAQSPNYVPGVSGWALKKDGTVEINGNVAGQGRLSITNQLIRVFDAAGTLRVRMGIWF